ncbi:MAG: TonB-dependent receptor plug domain-containing protein, partial [Alphaproteobacteria bacterium]|nr:TonB-dependent receptor plug domain-containing protein [Alphaproteobacteria bacterium]
MRLTKSPSAAPLPDRRHAAWLAGAAALALLASTPADAQADSSPAPVPPEAAVPATEDDGVIVVTARRRDESLQQVPIAVSVVTGAQLERTGSYNVSRLTQIQPTLTFYSTNPRNSAANIRGLGAPFGLTNDGIEQGVGIYVDQVYYSRIAAATFDFLDVERMEVLRGPQGTLYGKNTIGGAVRFVTKKPGQTPYLYASAGVGDYGAYEGKVSLMGPVNNQLALGISAYAAGHDGYVSDVNNGRKYNNEDTQALRGQLA